MTDIILKPSFPRLVTSLLTELLFLDDQVIELPKQLPEEVLPEFLSRLETLQAAGDNLAEEISSRLRLIV